ncbi:MAG: ABC transporter ATP-binding protein [Desulfosudaceae bacterium]
MVSAAPDIPEEDFSSETAAAPLLVGRGLSKGYDNNKLRIDVLRAVDFDIYSGETIAVMGASGIGKSTFLQIIGALDPPDSGTVHLAGHDVYGLNELELARLRNERIGFVFQFHHLLPEFNALENTMMPALIKGYHPDKARQSAAEMLGRVGLEARLEHRPSELSGGEQQRVAIARGLVLKPLLLLADEPTGNLDKQTSRRVHELLLDLNQELSMTLVVATHNHELAGLMTRKMTIVDGAVQEIDEAARETVRT